MTPDIHLCSFVNSIPAHTGHTEMTSIRYADASAGALNPGCGFDAPWPTTADVTWNRGVEQSAPLQ